MKKLKELLVFDTWGWVAASALILCAVSGVLLAVPYDIINPYLSVSRLVTANQAASYARNVHYWSAQLFLMLTIVHLFDHLLNKGEKGIRKKGVWFRLSFSLLFVFYVMISGFILKADGDSLQAQRILDSLLRSVPWAGSMLADTFVGTSGSLQLLYIQHAATASIIIFIVVLEHVRSLNVKLKTFILTFIIIGLVSLFFRAPLSELNNDLMKGPWYFIGLQEILHWLPHPSYAVAGVIFLPVILYLYYFLNEKRKPIILKFFFAFLIIYGLLTVTGLFFRGAMWQWQWPWQSGSRIPVLLVRDHFFHTPADTSKLKIIGGRVEGCMSCHNAMTGFSEAHKPEYIGCYACHGGDPLTLDKNLAHRRMYVVPGNLSNASAACGNTGCHPSVTERVPTSLMASLTGIVNVDRWVFGENKTPDGLANVHDIGHQSASDVHLRNLCAGCHLGMEKTVPGQHEWIDRGGGCLACHLNYDEKSLSSLHRLKQQRTSEYFPEFHPAINLNIKNDHCNSCHSRSGRISMNYEGWHETNLKPEEARGRDDLKTLPDQRVFIRQPADVHHTAGMLCVDCHGSYEVMGDENQYMHKEDAVKIQCSDCHAKKALQKSLITRTDQETQLIAWLRNYTTEGEQVVLTQKADRPLVNTRVEEDGNVLKLIKKSGAGKVVMKPPATVCSEGKVHMRLSCEACHTGWAPQCIGCHNAYEPETMGFDMLTRKPRKGTWVEFSAEGIAGLPVLGVNENDNTVAGGKITTFVPGMIMTIDKQSFNHADAQSFHRLYAPVSAHTTQTAGRSCVSCHNNPQALGFGRGSLTLSKSGKWFFDAEYANSAFDGLPEDAWTGFMKERAGQAATRLNMRPFNVEEQKRILLAGACLTCHLPESNVMRESLIHFDVVQSRMSSKCIKPVW